MKTVNLGGENGGGIQSHGSYSSITATTIEGNNGGSTVTRSFNIVSDNLMAHSGLTISGNGNKVANNTITDGEYIRIDGGSGNSIYANRIFNGFSLSTGGGTNNTFYANFVANSWIGIESYGGSNLIFHNNFVNNTHMFAVEHSRNTSPGTDYFDNGREGNYWGDYTARYPNATKVNGTGTWNVPYVLDDNNRDNHPLMLPFDIDNNRVTLPSPPEDSTKQEPLPTVPIIVTATVIGITSATLIVYFRRFKKKEQLRVT